MPTPAFFSAAKLAALLLPVSFAGLGALAAHSHNSETTTAVPTLARTKAPSAEADSAHGFAPADARDAAQGGGGRTQSQGYAGDNVRQGFGGYEKDGETGLNFAQARYYANTQGRYTSVDPLMGSAQPIHPQSWNRYAYCLNNPLKFIDPTGLIWGYVDNDGKRSFKWFDGDKAGDGYTAYDESSYRFANGSAAWLGDDGQWGWIDTVTADANPVSTSPYLYAEEFSTQMQKWGPALEHSMEIMWTADNLLLGGVTSLGSVGSAFRDESGHPEFTRVTSEGALTPGTYTAPASEGALPQSALPSRYNLPDSQILRSVGYEVRPLAGTWVVGPRPVMGGTGREVLFPFGASAGSVRPPFIVP